MNIERTELGLWVVVTEKPKISKADKKRQDKYQKIRERIAYTHAHPYFS